MLDRIKLLDVNITNETEEKVSEYVLKRVRDKGEKFFVTTPNPEILVYASSHLAYQDVLNQAEAALPDGIGIVLATQFLGKSVKNRITGTDFIETLCRDSKEKPVSMGFLGGKSGVAERAAQCLQKKYPWIDIAFVGEEWPKGNKKGEMKNEKYFSPLISHLSSQIDILFVAFGFPKQEEWIYKNLEKLPVKMAMGVGGAFDYLSGEVPRAPKFLRALGLEWLFRLIREPWRLKRQLALLTFISLVIKEKINNK